MMRLAALARVLAVLLLMAISSLAVPIGSAAGVNQDASLGLMWSTVLGGSSTDGSWQFTFDRDGNIYVVGSTASPDFPTTAGAYDTSLNGNDAFIAKLDPTGTHLLASTLFGGSGTDGATDIALDSEGNVVVTGRTESTDLPTTPGAYDCTANGMRDIYVAKFTPDLDQLLWCTYVGGAHDEEQGPKCLTVDADNRPIITGHTYSSDYPTTPGAFQTSFITNTYSGYITRLTADGRALSWSTFFSGSVASYVYDPTEAPDGTLLVCGATYGPTLFPTTPGVYDRTWNGGRCDSFAARFTATGELVWCTLLGGDGEDGAFDILTRPDGTVVIGEHSSSTDIPTSYNAYSTQNKGGFDIYVACLSADASTLIWGTYVGGTGWDIGSYGFQYDSSGNVWMSGYTNSVDLPVSVNAPQSTYGGGTYDACLIKIANDGTQLLFSTYLGGSANEYGGGLALDACGSAVICGQTSSADFPTTEGVYDKSFNGEIDTFLAKITECPLTVLSPNGGETFIGGNPIPVAWINPSACAGSLVRIELLQYGLLCQVLADSTENDGAYTWIPESHPDCRTGYQIRVLATQGCHSDASDSTFTVLGPHTPVGLTASASWKESAVEVTWSAPGEPRAADFEVRRADEGGTIISCHAGAITQQGSSFILRDEAVEPNRTYTYTVVMNERGVPAARAEATVRIPSIATALLQARPNPFAGSTRITFTLARESAVRLEILDVQGRLVRTLLDEKLPGGIHGQEWDGRDDSGATVSNGLYFFRLDIENGPRLVRKSMFLR